MAQTKEVERSHQIWFHYFTGLKLTDLWSAAIDGGYRTRNNTNQSLYLVRSGVNYRISPLIRVGVGFGHLGLFEGSTLDRVEYRPHQEFTLAGKEGRIKINQRLRVEERFVTDAHEKVVPEPDSFNFRFRYRLNFSIPVTQISGSGSSGKLFLNVGDELFINAGEQIVYDVFSMNRVLLGSTLQLSSAFSLRFIYNHQFQAQDTPGDYRQDHVFRFGLAHMIDKRGT